MDFQALARRELQALCKRNRIPANMTNVAMANALQALDLVEGIDEFQDLTKSLVKSAVSASRRSTKIVAADAGDVSDEASKQQASPLPRSRRVAAKAPDVMMLDLEGDEAAEEKKEGLDGESRKVDSPQKLIQYSRRASASRPVALADPGEQLMSPLGSVRRMASKKASDGAAEDQTVQQTARTARRAGKKLETNEGVIDTPAPRAARRSAAGKSSAAVMAVEEDKEVTSRMTTRRTRQSAKTVVDIATSAPTRRSTRAKATVNRMANLAAEEEQKVEKDTDINESSKLLSVEESTISIAPQSEMENIEETANVAIEELVETMSDDKQCELTENVLEQSQKNANEEVDSVANEVSLEISNASVPDEKPFTDNSELSALSEEKLTEIGTIEQSEVHSDMAVEFVDTIQHHHVEEIENAVEDSATQNSNAMKDFAEDQDKTVCIGNSEPEGQDTAKCAEDAEVDENNGEEENVLPSFEESPIKGLISSLEVLEIAGDVANTVPSPIDTELQAEINISVVVNSTEDASESCVEKVFETCIEPMNPADKPATDSEKLVENAIEENDAKNPIMKSSSSDAYGIQKLYSDADKENKSLVGEELDCEVNGENKLDLHSMSIRKLRAMVKDKLNKNQVEKRSALAALSDNCLMNNGADI